MMAGLTFFGFDINAQNPTLVLFIDQSRVNIQKLPFDHAPFDRIGAIGVQITDILTFDFFHRPEQCFEHRIIYMRHFRLELDVSFPHLARLICLREFAEESVRHQFPVLNTRTAGENMINGLKCQNTCDKGILTEYDILIAESGIGEIGRIETETFVQFLRVEQLIFFKIPISGSHRFTEITHLRLECRAVGIFIRV